MTFILRRMERGKSIQEISALFNKGEYAQTIKLIHASKYNQYYYLQMLEGVATLMLGNNQLGTKILASIDFSNVDIDTAGMDVFYMVQWIASEGHKKIAKQIFEIPELRQICIYPQKIIDELYSRAEKRNLRKKSN